LYFAISYDKLFTIEDKVGEEEYYFISFAFAVGGCKLIMAGAM
jgi:hypothetical protein